MTISERIDVIRENYACYHCLSSGHLAIDCADYESCVDGCDELHHLSLHPTSHSVNSISEENSGLLQLMEIPIKSDVRGILNVFWDSGSNISLILNSKTVGGVEKKEYLHKYRIPLVDSKGSTRFVMSYGINRITSDISYLNTEGITSSFNMSQSEVKRQLKPKNQKTNTLRREMDVHI